MSASLWQRNEFRPGQNLKTDVLIIGGGFIGLSTAFWLKEFDPSLQVTVLERKSVGSGASGKNAGFLTKGSAFFYQNLGKKWGEKKALDILSFAQESLRLLDQHILQTSGLKAVKTHSKTFVRQKEEFQLPPAFGFDWQPSSFQVFAGSWNSSDEFCINPMKLITFLKQIVTDRGVKIIEDNAAFSIQEKVQTELYAVEANKVVLALNGFSAEFHQAFTDVITPYRAQMLAVEIDGLKLGPGLNYDPKERVYFRQVEGNTLVIGGKRLLDEKGEQGSVEKVSPIIQKGLEQYLADVLGYRFRLINRWAGIMGFTRHELPYVEKIHAGLDTYLAAGFSGHGMGLGFHSAKEVAELVTGVKTESFFESFERSNLRL